MMCFSTSVICLLVVTCHNTFCNGYHTGYGSSGGEIGDATRTLDTSHSLFNSLQHGQNSLGFESNFSAIHHQNLSLPTSIEKNLVSANDMSTENSLKIKTRRKRQGATDRIKLPLPRHSEETSHEENNLAPLESQPTSELLLSLNDTVLSNRQEDREYSQQELNGISIGNRLANTEKTLVVVPESDEHEHHEQKHEHMCEKEHVHVVEGSQSQEPSADYHQHYQSSTQSISKKVWLYATLAVITISLCGLISVAVIPIMQKWFYHTLLQFLVGLAVGSLSGDGLLHLMPHAILDGESSHSHANESANHTSVHSMKAMEMKAIWRGLAALSGIFFFFIAERLLAALTTYRRQNREAKISLHTKSMVPVQKEDSANNGNMLEKIAHPKKNSYDHIHERDDKETIQMLQHEPSPSKKGSTHSDSVHEVGFHGRSSFSMEPEVTVTYRPESDSSVVVSEHHGHGHGHSHDIPQSVSAVAWMVIMGDGLHNFCDGLAIGAAFASGDADGISTTVAVFCHELPHELGDFAMLLKTGMKVKQALFYNLLSSVLCFIGMVIGVCLGNVHSATNWVFAGTAGMFLYIALVDMLPELSLPANTPSSKAITTLCVQVLGILIGICIMLLIALYEHELHSIVS